MNRPRTARLVELAQHVLRKLQEDEWDSDTISSIAEEAAELGLLEPDPDSVGHVRIVYDTDPPEEIGNDG